MAEYKANDKYGTLKDDENFKSIGAHGKHGMLVAGYTINYDGKLTKKLTECLDEIKDKKTTKKGSK